MEQREMPVMNVGITLVVLIFMNLCLITFSMLSLQNAVVDKKMTEKTANYTTAYYDAVSRLEMQWRDGNILLAQLAQTAKNESDFYQKLEHTLQKNAYPYAIEKREEGYYLICSEPVLEHQRLCGKAQILWQTEDGKYLGEKQSFLEENGSWEADKKIKVLK